MEGIVCFLLSFDRFVIAIYGAYLWEVLNWSWAKDIYDESNRRFPIRKYFKHRSDNIVVTLSFVPFVVFFAPEMVATYNDIETNTVRFQKFWYAGVGFLISVIYHFSRKFGLKK